MSALEDKALEHVAAKWPAIRRHWPTFLVVVALTAGAAWWATKAYYGDLYSERISVLEERNRFLNEQLAAAPIPGVGPRPTVFITEIHAGTTFGPNVPMTGTLMIAAKVPLATVDVAAKVAYLDSALTTVKITNLDDWRTAGSKYWEDVVPR